MADPFIGDTDIFPSDFFSIPHPTTPWISIQFRTKILNADLISDERYWEEITVNPSNHFDSCTIEDNGGFQKITLSLFDKNFERIETIITKSLIAARDASKVNETKTIVDNDTRFFEFMVDNHAMINLRIRFGYSVQADDTMYLDETEFNDKFRDRINGTIPVIRTPWIYFQMMGCNFGLNESGLTVNINAFSVTDDFLSRAKLVRKHAIMRGTPKELIESLNVIISNLSKNDLTLIIDDVPTPNTNDDGTQFIDVHMGGTPDDVFGIRSLKSVFSEICSKVPPKKYTADNNPIMENGDESKGKISKIIPYSYMSEQRLEGGKIKAKIHFYYPDPLQSEQKITRNYLWREHGMSIVKEMSINSKLDFASLNRQIIVKNAEDTWEFVTAVGEDSRPIQVNPKDLTNALAQEDFSVTFVSDVVDVTSQSTLTPSNLIAHQVVSFLNQGVFEGTMTIPGDPFYLFDTKVKPYQYKIKIIIMRTSYIRQDGSVVEEAPSYLSGHYVVKNITHTIGSSGFDTVLGITRWPTTT